MGVLDGKVVAVTGGGNGIGKDIALLAGKEGAKVLVNDLGCDIAGVGASAATAQAVADEIVAAGGIAVANGESVASMQGMARLKEQALDELGGLHAMINPAGIFRVSPFHEITEKDFDEIIEVHLRGAFNITRATIEHFKTQREGTYVHFSSTAGLIGTHDRVHYSAAKGGVMGLSRSLATEAIAYNVRSNIISPIAATRMSAGPLATLPNIAPGGDDALARMSSDKIAPLAVGLCASSNSHVTGQSFVVRGNEVVLLSQPRPVRTIISVDGWTPQMIVDCALPALEPNFTPIETTADVFPHAII